MAVKYSNMWSFLIIVIIAGHLSTSYSIPVADPLRPDATGNDNGAGEEKVRVRRYYVCPPDFERISNYCYYFSHHQATWQNAYYDCQDRGSGLAVLTSSSEDKKLRGQLNRSDRPLEWWIGGIYDWEQMKWKWISGQRFAYHGFSRMGPENKEKLKWHCAIMDPSMKYKWSARSCVLGKHYVCQTKVKKVGKKRLENLRKKYNNTLNEIPAPIYERNFKPRKSKKHENQANGYSTNLKQYQPNGINVNNNGNAYGRRTNKELTRKGGERRNRNGEKRKKRRKNRISGLHMNYGNSTETNGYAEMYKNARRMRRNKSKENNSLESATYSEEELSKRKKKKWNDENTSIDNTTPTNAHMTNTLSPLHPKVIMEEHDFTDFQILNNT